MFQYSTVPSSSGPESKKNCLTPQKKSLQFFDMLETNVQQIVSHAIRPGQKCHCENLRSCNDYNLSVLACVDVDYKRFSRV